VKSESSSPASEVKVNLPISSESLSSLESKESKPLTSHFYAKTSQTFSPRELKPSSYEVSQSQFSFNTNTKSESLPTSPIRIFDSPKFGTATTTTSPVESDSSDSVSNHTDSEDSSSNHSDSEDEFSMAATALLPVHFHGLQSEDSESWFRDLQHWCAYKKLDEAGKLGLVPLLLKDGARFWFDALDAGNKDTFDHLSVAFQQQYKRDESIKWRDSSEVWSCTQSSTQSVEDYISKVQQMAFRAKMPEDQLRFSIIRGLLPALRQSVLQHEPTTVDEIKKWATVAESAKLDTHDSTVVEAVKRLEEKFNTICAAPTDENYRTRSQSPRVRFQDERDSRVYSPGRRDNEFNDQHRAEPTHQPRWQEEQYQRSYNPQHNYSQQRSYNPQRNYNP
jgi:hypothetical protein